MSCVTPKHDVRKSLFFVVRTRCSGTQALYPAVLPSRPISHNILRFDQPMDTSQTSHPIQQSHSNFTVAIKRSACSRGLVVGQTNTSCCGVHCAQTTESAAKDGRCLHCKPRGEGEVFFLKREEVWGSTFSIWRGVLGNEILGQTKSWPIPRLCEVRPFGS